MKCRLFSCDEVVIPGPQKTRKVYCSRECQQKARVLRRDRPYAINKGPTCERCGFVPEHPCQLDVDHKDGNKANNDPSNLWTICACCHRLKTFLAKEWMPGR
jgi:hypothetical protein